MPDPQHTGPRWSKGFLLWVLMACACLDPVLCSPLCLSAYRCVLHSHAVIPVEGVCHHAGQLSPPLRPQVPAEAVLPAQLLKAHVLAWALSRGDHGLRASWMARVQVLLPFPPLCWFCSDC